MAHSACPRGDFRMVVRHVAQTVKEVLDGEGSVQRRLGKGETAYFQYDAARRQAAAR